MQEAGFIATNNCPNLIDEGKSCSVTCPEDYGSVGFFTCSLGVVVGDSVCVEESKRAVSTVTKIAGTMQISMTVPGNVSKEALKELFREGLAHVWQLQVNDVVKVDVDGLTRTDSSLRSQEFRRKQYEVAFEVLPSNSSMSEILLQQASAIFVPESHEAQIFRQFFESHQHVNEVDEILVKIPVRIFQDEVLVQIEPADDSSSLPYAGVDQFVIRLAAVATGGMLCLVLAMFLWKKKCSSLPSQGKCKSEHCKTEKECSRLDSAVVVHMPTLLKSVGTASSKEPKCGVKAATQHDEVYLSQLEEAKMVDLATCTRLEYLAWAGSKDLGNERDTSEMGQRIPSGTNVSVVVKDDIVSDEKDEQTKREKYGEV
jgi:hypothetical protein